MHIIEIVCTELREQTRVQDGVGIVRTGGFSNTGVNCLPFGACRASAGPRQRPCLL